MNLGFYTCIVLCPFFVVLALVFAVLKEKSAKLISGFNMLPKEEQELYDKAQMAKDMRNEYFCWGGIMLAGAVGSYAISEYIAFIAYLLWGILFFKNVHLDARKAFQKYRK